MPLLNQSIPSLPLDAREVLGAVREATTDEQSLVEDYILAAQHAVFSQVRRAVHYTKYDLVEPRFPKGPAGGRYNAEADTGLSYFPLSSTAGEYAEGYVNGIELRVVPFLKVESLQYYDADGVSQTLTEGTDFYAVDGGCNSPATLYPFPGSDWPDTQSRIDAVRITFWAGEVAELNVDTSASAVLSTNEYEFTDGDVVTISSSGNTNEYLSGLGLLQGIGASPRKKYYVRDASGVSFNISETLGGSALAISADPNGTHYAGTISPLVHRAILATSSSWWMNACSSEDCSSMHSEAMKLASITSALRWNTALGN